MIDANDEAEASDDLKLCRDLRTLGSNRRAASSIGRAMYKAAARIDALRSTCAALVEGERKTCEMCNGAGKRPISAGEDFIICEDCEGKGYISELPEKPPKVITWSPDPNVAGGMKSKGVGENGEYVEKGALIIMSDYADALLALLKEREEAELDAARYRWLRGKNHVAYGRQNLMLGNFDADLDAAIDSAIDSALTRKDDDKEQSNG